MKFDIYADPSHAWCKVSLKKLLELGIAEHISRFSYVHGDFAFLEEDRDLQVFIEAMKKAGRSVSFREHHADRSSRIRRYESYDNFQDQFKEDLHYNIPLNQLDFVEMSNDGNFYEVNLKPTTRSGFRFRECPVGAVVKRFRSTKCISYEPPYLVIK
jgi:hypothetical protein